MRYDKAPKTFDEQADLLLSRVMPRPAARSSRLPSARSADARFVVRLKKQRELATLAPMLRWLRLGNRLARLLAGQTGPRRQPLPALSRS